MTAATTVNARMIPIDNVIVDADANARQDANGVEGLAESIKLAGILTPLTVTEDGVLIAGHRRYAAAKQAGLSEVPVIVVTTTDDVTSEAIAAAENIARRQLTAAEEADAVGRMLANGFTSDGAAKILDMPLARVKRREQLLTLPLELRSLWGPGGGAPPSAVPNVADVVATIPDIATAMYKAHQLASAPRKPNEYGWRPPAIQEIASDPGRYLKDLYNSMAGDEFNRRPVKGMPAAGDFIVVRLNTRMRADKNMGGAKAQAAHAKKATQLEKAGVYGVSMEIAQADIDAAVAAGVTIDIDSGPDTPVEHIIISRAWLSDQLRDVILPRYLQEADAAIKRGGRRNQTTTAASRAKAKAGGKLTAAEQRELDQATATRDAERRWKAEARGANLDLGRALLDNMGTVELTADIARFFAETSLGRRSAKTTGHPYYPGEQFYAARLAAGGLRYVMVDWQTEKPKPTKADPAKTVVDYLDISECEARLWKWFDGAKEPGEILGRALIIHAAARWATEIVVPQAQQNFPSHRNQGYRGVVPPHLEKLLERIAKSTIPASVRKLIREMQHFDAAKATAGT